MYVYYQNNDLTIRAMKASDIRLIYNTFLSYDWHPNLETYKSYLTNQEKGIQQIFIAEMADKMVGFCTLILNPTEGALGNKGIPEISDLVVFYGYQRKEIGSHLMTVAEQEAARVSNRVYLAVGLHSGYGSAQRLYAKRNYLPDGTGVWYRGHVLEPYVACCNDDDLLLYLSKDLER